MKRIVQIFLLVASIATGGVAHAQERTISGKVTSADDGTTLPGVNVMVKGTSTGTVTDANGAYTITIPATSGTLVFSFIGLQTQEVAIGDRAVLDVAMANDVTQLSEVVVTALGIERSRNELAYAAQQVDGKDISANRSTNFVNSLSGKVAGVDIKTSNTMGGSTNVVIRGYKSISGNNQALFVIDGIPVSNANTNTASQRGGSRGADYGNAAADINPDNIASVNVLKGAAATTLYGSRASNGVIMITTKKGRKNSFEVTLNSGATWGVMDKSTYTRYQNQYGGGYSGNFGANVTLDDGSHPRVVYGDDASMGPAFDGQPVYQWDAYDPFSSNYRKATPWVATKNTPDNAYFETALSSNQSISISAGGDKSVFKFGYTRSDEKGMLPNSSLDKNLFNFSITQELNEKLSMTASANYSRILGVGRYGTGYNEKNPNQAFRQWWQTNVDIKAMKEAYFRNRQNVTWNWNSTATGPLYSDNPYWSRYENYSNDSRDHFFGYANLNYKITSWLEVMGRIGYDGTTDLQEERNAIGSYGVSSYSRFNRSYMETNYDLLFNINKDINEDLTFKGVLGSNMRRSQVESIRVATNGGLVVPRLYSLSNSRNALNPPTEAYERVGVDGLFANANVGYKETVFVELSARQDKSTTLPVDNNSYLYYSAAGTFVFSNVIKKPWLSMGKIRGNYARVGNDATALSLYDVYDKPTGIGSVPIFSLPNTKNNSSLKPEFMNSVEAGLEADFFDGRFGFDFTWYKTSTIDQILNVEVTGATGYTGKWVNSGEVENKGVELSLFAVPVHIGDFSWTVNLNYTRNRNLVKSLYGEGDGTVTNYTIASPQGGVSLNAAVGYPYGVIRGHDYLYTNGQPTVNADGYYEKSVESDLIIGDPNPDWLGGINNAFKYKNLSFSFLVDIRSGGDIFSLDQWYGESTGLYPHTAGLNDKGIPIRTPVAQGGGILLPGVQADGSPNTVYAEVRDAVAGITPFGYAANFSGEAPHKMYVYDGSYVKLRELAVNYSLPKAWLAGAKVIKGVDVSLIGRNLWIIDKNMEFTDPEEGLSSGNANGGYQSGAYPMAKTYGFNVKLTF